jgi:hypothetical protein
MIENVIIDQMKTQHKWVFPVVSGDLDRDVNLYLVTDYS